MPTKDADGRASEEESAMTERSETDADDHRAAFAPRFRRQLWITGATLVAIVPLLAVKFAGWSSQKALPFTIVAIGMIAAALVASLWNWRCSGCKGYLGRRLFVRFCDRCGARLR
jgi:fatty acid desaturase